MKIKPVKNKRSRAALALAVVAASGVLSGCDIGVKNAGEPAADTTTSQVQTEGIYTTSATTTTAVGTYTTSVSTPLIEGTYATSESVK